VGGATRRQSARLFVKQCKRNGSANRRWRPVSRRDNRLGAGTGGRLGSARIDDGAQHDAAFFRVIIAGAGVHRRPLVPYQKVADTPRVVVGEEFLRGMCGEFFDQLPRLFALHSFEAMSVHRVDKQGRTAGDRRLLLAPA